MYFNIVIENKTFYIEETSTKPSKRSCALEMLKKINEAIENKYEFSPKNRDNYSELTLNRVGLINKLDEISLKIYNGYEKKQSTLNWIIQKIFKKSIINKKEELDSVYQALGSKFQSNLESIKPQFMELPGEMVRAIMNQLRISELGVASVLNKEINKNARFGMDTRAKEFGYDEKLGITSHEYMKTLFQEIEQLSRTTGIQGIMEKYLVYKKGSYIATEDSLRTLQHLNAAEVLSLLIHLSIYVKGCLSSFKLWKILGKKSNWMISAEDSDDLKKLANKVLVYAIKGMDEICVKDLLERKVDADFLDEDGKYPLYYAAKKDSEMIVKYLIEQEHQDEINQSTQNKKNTALALACGADEWRSDYRLNPAIIKLLLENGADPNFQDANNSYPLHRAAKKGCDDIVKMLLEHHADVKLLAEGHNTALVFACGFGTYDLNRSNLKVVRLLLENGVDPNAVSLGGRSPLHHAIVKQSKELVMALLEFKADINARDIEGETPLHYALRYNCIGIVGCLLNFKGIDVHAQDNNGMTPLHYAVQIDREDVVERLIELNANVNCRDNNRNTPLHYVNNRWNENIFKKLINSQADINAKNSESKTPLHVAITIRNDSFFKFLLDLKANVNAVDKSGKTPLHYAVELSDEYSVECLLDLKANVNAVDKSGKTPLHYAAKTQSRNIAQSLIRLNAKVHARDNSFKTPLDYAREMNNEDLIDYLCWF
jgi:ankyrin repeat protein